MSYDGNVIEETSSSSDDNEFPSSSAPTERVKNNTSSSIRDKGRLSLKKCHKPSGADTNSQVKQSTGLKVSRSLFAPRKSLFAPSKEKGKTSGKNGEQNQQSNLASHKGKAFRNSIEDTLKTSLPNSQDVEWEGPKSLNGHSRQTGAVPNKTFVRERNSSSLEAQEMPSTCKNEATVSDDRSSRAGSSLKSPTESANGSSLKSPTESAKQYEKAGCSGTSSKKVFVISESENDDDDVDSADDYNSKLTGEPASTKKRGLVSEQGKSSSISNSSNSSVNSSSNIGSKKPDRSENLSIEIPSSESSDFESPCNYSQKMKNNSQVNQKVSDKRNWKDTPQAKQPNKTSTRRVTKRGLAKSRTGSTDSSVPLTVKVSSSQVEESKPHIAKEGVEAEVVAEEKLVVTDDNDDGKLPELLKVDPQSSFSEDSSASSKDASDKLATDANERNVSIFETIKKKKLTLFKLATASINSLRKKDSKLEERANDVVVISDEELEESNNNSQLEPPTTIQRQDSNADNKTSLLKSSTGFSKSWSLSRSSTMASNGSGSETCDYSDLRQIVSNSLTEDSSHCKDQNVFPALGRCESDCSLSQEVPYQGEVENQNVKCHENSASSDPNHDSPLRDSTFSSMPSLQRQPSSVYEQEHPQACSLLSQYFPESHTSTLLEKSTTLSLSCSPESMAETDTGKNSVAASGKRSPSSESSSNANVKPGIFTGSMFSFNNKTQDNVREKVKNILDMLDSEDVTDPVPESRQPLQWITLERHGPEPKAPSPENELPEFNPGISLSIAISAGQGSSVEPNLAVVKTEKDGPQTDTASASFYSEIDDDIYVLDSDDEVYFQSQSIQSCHSIEQDKSEESALEEKQSDDFLIIDFDDEEAATWQIEAESSSKSFVVTNDDDGNTNDDDNDDDGNTNNGDDVFGRRISFSGISNMEPMNTRDLSTDDFHKKHSFSADSSNYCGNSLKNKLFDESSSAKDPVDNDSQTLMDDDDVYIAHTQVDYTNYSDNDDDDDAEQAKEGAELTEGNTSPAGNQIPSGILSFKGSNDSALKNTRHARFISEMSDSSQGSNDTQDPFSVQTQQCSAEDAQSLYDAETQPYSLPLDEDTQDPLDKQDENEPIAGDNSYKLETQAVSPPEARDHFSQNASSAQDKKLNRKICSDSDDTQDPFTNIQECLTTNDTYQKQSENACIDRLDMEDTQDPFNTETQMDFSPNKIPSSGTVSSISLNPAEGNQILFEGKRELPVSKLTLYDKKVPSTPVLSNRNMGCKKSTEDLFNTETQKEDVVFNSKRDDENCIGDSESFFFTDTQRVQPKTAHSVSPDKKCNGGIETFFHTNTLRMEHVTHSISHDKDPSENSEGLFSAETQRIEPTENKVSPGKDSSENSQTIFCTATQKVEPIKHTVSLSKGSSEDSERLFSVQTQRIEPIEHVASPDKDSSGDSERVFSAKTQLLEPPAHTVSSLEDSSGDSEIFFSADTRRIEPAASRLSPNKDSSGERERLFSAETQRMAVTSHAMSPDKDSSGDSERLFSAETQLVEPPADGAISPSSFSEDSHGPFSVETQIDSDSKSECPYDKETISMFTDEDTQDPYSLETVKDSTQSQASMISASERTSASLLKDPDNVFLIETQKVRRYDSVSGSCDKETTVLSGSPRGDKDSSEEQVDLEQEQDNQDWFLAATQVDDPHITGRDNLPGSNVNSRNDPQFVEEEVMFIGETVVDMPASNSDRHTSRPVVDCSSQKVSETYKLNQSSKHSHGLIWKNSMRNDQPAKPGGFNHLGPPELESHNSRAKAKQTILLAEIPDRKIKKLKIINAPEKSSYDLEQLKKHIPHILPNDYRSRCSYVDVSSFSQLHEKASTASTFSFRQNSNYGKMAVTSSNEVLCSNNSAMVQDTDASDIGTDDIGVASSSSHTNFRVKIHEKNPTTENNKSYYKCNMVSENPSQWANIPGKRSAVNENTQSVKRMRPERVGGHKIPLSVENPRRKHYRENEFEETAPAVKRSKGRLSSDDSKSSWMTASKSATSNNSKFLNKNNPRNQRSISCNSEESRLSLQMQSARHIMENRRLESTKYVHEHKEASTHIPSKPRCNDDVEMPSTQDMMRFGLPILSAQLPVSKKHFAAGLPSQGRIASEEKKQIIKGHSLVKNKLTVSVPPVPKLQATNNSASDVISSNAAVHTATSEILVSSTANVKELSRDQTSNVSISEPVTSGNTTTKSVAFNMMPPEPALQQPSQTVSISTQLAAASNCSNQAHGSPLTEQPNQTAGPCALAFSVEKTLHSYKGTKAHPTSTFQPNQIAGPSSITPQPRAIGETSHGHKSIIKNNMPQSSNSSKPLPRVNFKASPDIHWIQGLPPASSVLHESAEKPRPEVKLHFLSTILKWSPKWLEERELIQRLPELFGSGKKIADVCCQLRMFYTSFQEYVDITLNLLVLECWETIYRNWKTNKIKPPIRIEVHLVCLPRHPYKIREGLSLMHAEFMGIVAQEDRYKIPLPGDVLTIDFWGARKLQSNTYDKENFFQQLALVHSISIQNTNLREKYKIFESSTVREKNPLPVRMTLVLLKKAAVISPSKLHVIQAISSITSIERQVDALVNLPESPLCAHLLKPESRNVFVHRSAKLNFNLRSKLNQEQATAVETILQSVCGDPKQQKFFLLQGPPGTGKSHTILALIHQILVKNHFKVRICLATPSNAAVDEIATRIIGFSNKLTKLGLQAISLVRVGKSNKVLSSVKPFMYEELVEKELIRDVPPSLLAELNSREKQMSSLVSVLNSRQSNLTNEQRIVKARRCKELRDIISTLKTDIMSRKKKTVRQRYIAKCHVLDTAHVICGTLNSLGSDDIREIILRNEENCHKHMPFSCLIIDEATQAIEVDSIIPLRFKMTKVILVGDQEQLPATVLSQEASERRLARSLFERVDLCVREFSKCNTLMMLTRQYRMHPEILSFPNSFYDGRLVTDESVLAREVTVAPYLVFDIQESRESRNGSNRSVSNESEAICTAQLCEIVKEKINNIGVICPYADQREAITDQLRNKGVRTVQVNTVDSFQGQEREVIIMSCVRAQSSPSSIGFLADMKRLNVALTRAKQALYVIGHFSTLCTDDLWKGLYHNALDRGLLIKVTKLEDFKCCAEKAILKKGK